MTLNKAYQEERRKLIVNFLSSINAYNPENLCPELAICLKARESAEILDKYCSGNYKNCPYKTSTN